MELTTNEIAVMRSLANNHYGDQGDGVWAWAINDSQTPSGITGKSLSGVVGSLCKKGLIASEEYEKNEDVIWMKDAGRTYITENKLVEGE